MPLDIFLPLLSHLGSNWIFHRGIMWSEVTRLYILCNKKKKKEHQKPNWKLIFGLLDYLLVKFTYYLKHYVEKS